MSDALSFAEIEKQRVELLPARTVLSMFSAVGTGGTGGSPSGGTGTGTSVPGVTGGEAEASASHFDIKEGDLIMIVTGGAAGTGGSASGSGAGVVER